MRSIKLVLFVACAPLLSGCLGTLKVLSAIGEGQQQVNGNPPTQPIAYPTYDAPQVVQPQQQKSTDHFYCNTIGYVTTCKEI